MIDVVLLVAGLNVAEYRVGRPCFPGRAGLRRFCEPHFQALVRRVGRQQPVQRGRAGAGQPGDEDGTIEAGLRVFGVRLPRCLTEQPGHQRAAQEDPLQLPAQRGQARVPGVGVQQHGEAVAVGVGAELRQAGEPGGRGVQVLDRADAVPLGAHWDSTQWWYSPQLTSRHWPVMARAMPEARNTTASAISSGSGSLPRSIAAAVSS